MSNINNNFKIDLAFDGDFKSSSSGDLEQISGKDNLKQKIFNKLMTVPGTLLHRPDWGIGITQYQGSVSSIEKQREIALKIKEQLEEEDGILSVKSVSIKNNDPVTGAFEISLKIEAEGVGEIVIEAQPFEDIF